MFNFFRPFLILMCFLFIGESSVLGQDSTHKYNSLLWRISGNGLSKPSYLYGTMHLTKKKLFYFSDSLYHALENSEGFAGEINMNEMSGMISKMILQREDTTEYLAERVSPKFLEKYHKELETEFNVPPSEITMKDIEKAESKSSRDNLLKGEMPTFMDAYLYNIARRQGKWVGGLEDIDDQLNLHTKLKNQDIEEKVANYLKERKKNTYDIDWMMNIYLNADLDQIDVTSKLWKGSYRTELLYKRNIKMVHNIDSISHIRTCLYAVGAAHLPGDSGIVEMLRQQGYIVEAVMCEHKIEPNKYIYKSIEMPWVNDTFKTENFSFKIQSPDKMSMLKEIKGMPLNLYMYMDITTITGYMTCTMENEGFLAQVSDTILNKMIARMALTSELGKVSTRPMGEVTGKLVEFKGEQGHYLMHVFLYDGLLVMNMYFRMNEITESDMIDADQYFNSFKLIDRPKAENKKSGIEVKRKNLLLVHGMAIQFPVMYTKGKLKSTPKESYMWQFNGVDVLKNAYYGVTITETRPLYHYQNDDEVVKNSTQAMGDKLGGNFEVYDSILLKNIYHKIYRTEGYMETVHAYTYTSVVLRGNKRYILIALVSDSTDTLKCLDFIKSFRYTDYDEVQLAKVVHENGDYEMNAPGPLYSDPIEEVSNITERKYVFDSITSTTFFIDKIAPLSKYYWAQSDSMLFADMLPPKEYGDDAVSQLNIQTINGFKTCDLSISNSHSSVKAFIHLVLKGDTIYRMISYGDEEAIASENYKRISNSFKLRGENKPTTLFKSKASVLLKMLKSADSATIDEAVKSIQLVQFSSKDLKALHKAFLLDYPDSTGYNNSYKVLAEQLLKLNDPATLKFIEKNYFSTKKYNEYIYSNMLEIAARFKTAQSYNILLKGLMSHKTNRTSFSLLNYYCDSQNLTRTLFPDLYTYISDTNYISFISQASCRLIDSNLMAKETLLPYLDKIHQSADYLINHPESYFIPSYSFMKLLKHFDDAKTIEYLHKFAMSKSPYTSMYACSTLVEKKIKLSAEEIYYIASKPESRTALYELLDTNKMASQFPAEFKTQRYFAESELYNNVMESYDMYADSVHFIEVKRYIRDEKTYCYYLFQFIYSSYDSIGSSNIINLAVIGPYEKDSNNLKTTGEANGIETDEVFDEARIDELFERWMDKKMDVPRKED